MANEDVTLVDILMLFGRQFLPLIISNRQRFHVNKIDLTPRSSETAFMVSRVEDAGNKDAILGAHAAAWSAAHVLL